VETGAELKLRKNLGRQSRKGQKAHGIYGYGALVIDLKKIPFGCPFDLAEGTRTAGEARGVEMKCNGHRKKAERE
jgi:hypothetical protein